MEITRETVNEWLKETHRNREWLAEKCGTSLSNVGMWLNKKGEPREIPGDHKITIKSLMDKDAADEAAKQPPAISQNLVLYPTREQFRQWEEAAMNAKDGPQHLEDWAIEGLDRLAKQWIYSQAWKVAEERPPKPLDNEKEA